MKVRKHQILAHVKMLLIRENSTLKIVNIQKCFKTVCIFNCIFKPNYENSTQHKAKQCLKTNQIITHFI